MSFCKNRKILYAILLVPVPIIYFYLKKNISPFIRQIILQSPKIYSNNKDFYEDERDNLFASYSNVRSAIAPVYDNNKLVGSIDILTFSGNKGNRLRPEDLMPAEKWIIYCGGNAEVMESSVDGVRKMAKDLYSTANVVLFNYRGVGRSQGTTNSARDLTLDAEAVGAYVKGVIQTKYWDPFKTADSSDFLNTADESATKTSAMSENFKNFSSSSVVNERNILIIGHSLGGIPASHSATNVFKDSPVIFDRTFSNLYDTCKSLAPFGTGYLLPSSTLKSAFGEYDVLKVFNSINHDRKFVLFHKNDNVINYEKCSLARPSNNIPSEFLYELLGGRDYHNYIMSSFQNSAVIFDNILKKIEWKQN